MSNKGVMKMQDNPVRAHQRREFEKRTERLQADFGVIGKEDVRKLPESIFVRDFLPLFSGESTQDRENLLSYWYLIAGTPYHPVDLIDERGQFVIQVPPLQDRNVVNPAGGNGKELSAVFEEAKQKSSLSPALGQQIIANALHNNLQNKLSKDVNKEHVALWEALMSHYGKSLSSTASAKNNQGAASESDFEIE